MRRTSISLAIAAIFIFSPTTFAATGEELLQGLRAADNPYTRGSLQAGLAMGFVSGASSVASHLGAICPPGGGASALQMAAIVKQYIEAHPEKWQLPADQLAVQAMVQAFPCPMPRQ
jgi:hypothetical protein